MGGERLVMLAGCLELDDFLHAFRCNIGDGRNHAHAAQAHDLKRVGVISGVNGEAGRSTLGYGGNLVHLSARFLDRDDVLVIVREPQGRLCCHVDN